jgi:hypothetical protein
MKAGEVVGVFTAVDTLRALSKVTQPAARSARARR